MEQGKAIVLDEINLLPFDSLRFLQGILDGKSEIIYKGNVITIAEGFQVIATMNLVVNGTVFNLPSLLLTDVPKSVSLHFPQSSYFLRLYKRGIYYDNI